MESTSKIKQNLDTNFLKLIAIISMAVDHTAKNFFPDNIALAMIGRIAFPLFAYCLVVGCLYTRSTKNYIGRLFVFAIISQPFYVMAFHPTWEGFIENILVLNIFFTLIAGVLVINALMNIKKNWWMILIAVAMEFFIGLDYGIYGIILMVIFYLCRNKSWLSFILIFIWMSLSFPGDFIHMLGFGIDLQFFAVLSLPLIYIHTGIRPKINKYFFYIFYPAHLFVIFLVRFFYHI